MVIFDHFPEYRPFGGISGISGRPDQHQQIGQKKIHQWKVNVRMNVIVDYIII